MTLFIADTCDDEILGGGGGSGSNVTSFTYTYATETGTIATDQPATFNAVIPMVNINQTIYVDPTYGNDGTAIPDSMALKYATIDAALAAWTNDYVIHCLPGTHTMNVPYTVTDIVKIHLDTGARLVVFAGFSIDPGTVLWIQGDGVIELATNLFQNTTPTSAAPAEVYIRCSQIDSSGSGTIGDVSSMKFSIEADRINDRGLICDGWCYGYVATDEWVMSGTWIRLNDFNSNKGEKKYDGYGPQVITVKGRTRKRCHFLNSISVPQGLYLNDSNTEKYKTQVILWVDFDSTDGFFVDQGRGIIRHNGNLIHRKSNTAGNEVPWYFQQQDPKQDTKPHFIHEEGDYVSGTNVLFASSLNNELFAIRALSTIELNGKYQNSGEETGLGAWPILDFKNQSGQNGSTEIILNGEFKNLFKDAALIKFTDITNPIHTYKLIVKNTLMQTDIDGETISTNIAMPIYVFHSLAMNTNYNPLIYDGVSTSRTIVDSYVSIDVPEYGL